MEPHNEDRPKPTDVLTTMQGTQEDEPSTLGVSVEEAVDGTTGEADEGDLGASTDDSNQTVPSPETPQDVFMRPYVEVPVLAAFVSAEELARIYPASRAWPVEVAKRARGIYGKADLLPERPYAGSARLTPVEEPMALQVLDPVSHLVALDHTMPTSFNWVEIANLIATQAVTEPLSDATLPNNDAPTLADYSLYSAPNVLQLPSGGLLATEPVQVVPLGQTPEMFNGGTGPQQVIAVRYALQRTVQPIVVGYHEGRVFLLKGYGRVLRALSLGVERLLCLVYYGLDLGAPDFGVRVPGIEHTTINHLGHRRLYRGPLVRDFLDPALSVMTPARAKIWEVRFFAATSEASPHFSPEIELPLQ